MVSLEHSMSSAIATMLPTTLFNAEYDTEKDIAHIAMRVAIINGMLDTLLLGVTLNPSLWQEMDTDFLAKQFSDNKQAIEQVRPLFSEGNRTLALLDKMKSTLLQLETQLPPKREFNFDLERMKDRVNDTFHLAPQGVTNVNEFRQWLKATSNGH